MDTLDHPEAPLAWQLRELCERSAAEHGDTEDVPSDYFLAVPSACMRADDAVAEPSDQWKSTPSEVEAVVSRMRDDGFVVRLYTSSVTDPDHVPLVLFVELGLTEAELMGDAEALQLHKRCKRFWGGRYGFLRFSTERATVDLREHEPEAEHNGVGIFAWCSDAARTSSRDDERACRHRRFTSAERLRILLDKLRLSTAVTRLNIVDASTLDGYPSTDEANDNLPPATAAADEAALCGGCCRRRARVAAVRAAQLKLSRGVKGLGCIKVAGGGADGAPGLRVPALYFSDASPIHESGRRRAIRNTWVNRTLSKSAFRQKCATVEGDEGDNELMRELDDLNDYFGSQVALYFAFATQLMMWLAIPAVIGGVCWVVGWWMRRLNVYLVPAYCTALMVWATLFAEYVERLKEICVFRWGGAALIADAAADDDGGSAALGSPAGTHMRAEYKQLLREAGIDPDEPDPIEVSTRIERTWRRRARMLVSALTMLLSTTAVILVMTANLTFRLWLARNMPQKGPIYGGLVTGLTISLLGMTFRGIAGALTRWECWRTEAQHEDALIAKIFIFEVFNNYSSLFYIAFVRAHIGRVARALGIDAPDSEECDTSDECLRDLELQLGAILFAKAILFKMITVGTIRLTRAARMLYNSHIVPCVNRLLRRRALEARAPAGSSPTLARWLSNASSSFSSLSSPKPGSHGVLKTLWSGVGPRTLSQESVDASASLASPAPGGLKPDGAAPADGAARRRRDASCAAESEFSRPAASTVVDEYKELVIMYGYIVLFASAFPIAPFLCIISTGLEMRADAFKFCEARRTVPRQARHHPLWFQCAQLLTTVAVMTNIALVLFTVPDALPKKMPLSLKIGLLLFVEHAILIARWMLQVLVPDKPMEVLRGMLESKKAFKTLHAQLLRAHADGRGGGGGLTNLELMQLGLHSIVAQGLKAERDRMGTTWRKLALGGSSARQMLANAAGAGAGAGMSPLLRAARAAAAEAAEADGDDAGGDGTQPPQDAPPAAAPVVRSPGHDGSGMVAMLWQLAARRSAGAASSQQPHARME